MTPTGSWSEPEGVQLSIETLKGGSEIGCNPKFWRVVVAATTLGDTLLELQLLCFASLLAHGLGILGSIEMMCGLLHLPHLPHGHTWFTLCQLSETQSKVQLDYIVSNSGRVV